MVTGWSFGLERRWGLILLAATGAALFYPLLTHLERGQIDALTLLLIVLASVGMGRRTPRAGFTAGVLLCAATLLKLHCLYMLPFLLIRKKGRVLLGYLCGGLLIAALTAVAPGGIESTLDYLTGEMPRISRFGEWGTDDMRLPKEVLAQQRQGLPDHKTTKGGVIYQRESFSFTANGTLVRVLQQRLQKAQIWASNTLVSALTLVVLFAGMVVWQVSLPGPLHLDRRGEFLYWQGVALIVMLAAPLTWVMNLVWLLPLFVVLPAELTRTERWQPRVVLGLGIMALIVIALPDGVGSPLITPTWAGLISFKYVVGESLLLLSLLGYLASFPRSHASCTTPERANSRHW